VPTLFVAAHREGVRRAVGEPGHRHGTAAATCGRPRRECGDDEPGDGRAARCSRAP
jgi:hypothetical protein